MSFLLDIYKKNTRFYSVIPYIKYVLTSVLESYFSDA